MEKENYLEQVKEVTNNSPCYKLLGMEIMEIKEG
jgi:hypothetical protein